MQASKHASDTPGWCSDPSLKMSPEVIAALDEQRWVSYLKMSDLREYAVDDDGWIDPNSLKGGSGDRTLYQVAEYDDDGDDEDEDRANKIWMIEDAEYMAKYGIDNVRGGTFSQATLSDAQRVVPGIARSGGTGLVRGANLRHCMPSETNRLVSASVVLRPSVNKESQK